MRIWAATALTLLLGALLPLQVGATLITVSFEGVVDIADAGKGIGAGETLSGGFTYDDTAVDTVLADPGLASYTQPNLELILTFSVGGVFLLPFDALVTIRDHFLNPGSDAWHLCADQIAGDGPGPDRFILGLGDPTNTAHSSDALVPPVLENFSSRPWSFADASGRITSLSSSAPEPSVFQLAGLGVAAFMLFQARRSRVPPAVA